MKSIYYYLIHCFLIIGAIVFMALGLLALIYLPKMVTKSIEKEDFLGREHNGTFNSALKKFQSPEYNVTLQIWVFSIQNANDVKNGAKPTVVEKGPYSFSLKLQKNISFASNDTRIFYNQNKRFFFNKTLSCHDCFLSDKVTVPNILFQKVVNIWNVRRLRFLKPILDRLLSRFNETIFIGTTVGELLFDGYDDPLLTEFCGYSLAKPICNAFAIPQRIGLFYNKNNTNDGQYEIDTGLKNVKKLGHVYSWNNMNSTLDESYWYGSMARLINGTNGEIFHPTLFSAPKIHIFIGDLCRSFEMNFGGFFISQGMPSYRYRLPESAYNVTFQKELGFCNPETPIYFNDSRIQQEGCAPPGLLDMETCFKGSSRIYLSQPYFKDSPVELNQAINGLPAQGSAGDNYFDIEPSTGVLVQVQQHQQINLGILNGNLSSFKNMSQIIVPMIWYREIGTIDPDTRSLVSQAFSALERIFVIGICMIVLSVFLMVCSLGLFFGKTLMTRPQNVDVTEPLVNTEQPPVELPEEDYTSEETNNH